MSVLFTSVSASSPVTVEEVRRIFGQLGFSPAAADEDDYVKLLAALHDCAEKVASLPDYEPPVDLKRFSRKNIRHPSSED
ncbi:hypothetical protein VTN00DRAFT_6410 [Thermoascus crustaceus]|uniref:uncharacterized protein n=1 Tax=Thermoascus crustaceus TaxID=5088 RepID=UPI0037446B86